ncbi:hypothetical protein BT96DRAFT_920341 [Gymnopus androsaceus JB14]|uniref:Translation initiation factor 3 N-terminal domain-containing protein n=1 Tax=Gymnopus androsaceus JB14 TaxID=1447944 RepID=A0A6A4HJV8_9AGAR|nr:hypothetical protein BT96DRAFT_920341 [Gymnopus androsaceus JB14]
MATFLAFRSAAKQICSPKIRPHTFLNTPHTRRLHASAVHHSKYQKPRNDNIPFSDVHLVDLENSGQLVKMSLTDLIAKIDPKESFVELQSTVPLPVVKIINRREAAERRKISKEKHKQNVKKNVKKELQFTWGMAMGDLEHKLDRAKAELKKGARVDLVFAPKSGQKPPPIAEMKERMELIAERVADVGVEWKERELRRGMGALFIKSLGMKNEDEEENSE